MLPRMYTEQNGVVVDPAPSSTGEDALPPQCQAGPVRIPVLEPSLRRDHLMTESE